MNSPSRDETSGNPGVRAPSTPRASGIEGLGLPIEALEELAESAPVGIYVAQGGVLCYVNPSLALAFDCSREEMRGRPLADLVAPEDRPALGEHLAALSAGRQRRFEMRTRMGLGGRMAGEVRLTAVAASHLGQPAVTGMWVEATSIASVSESPEETDALARASSRLLGAENLEWLAREIVDSAVQDLRKACVSLFVLDDRRSLVQLACSDPSMSSARPLHLNGPGITVAAAVNGETLNVPDVTKDPRYLPDAKAPGSELAIPLRAGGRVVGVLNLESSEKNAFDERDVRILQTFAARAATAVENARLHERLRNRTKQLERFHELSLMMIGDHVEIHRAIVRQMVELLSTPYASLVRIEGPLIRSLAIVSPGNDPSGEACPIDMTPCRVVRDTRESCIFRSVSAEFSQDPFLVPRAIKTFIGVPVFDRRGEVVGILNAMDRRERNFGAEELRILNLLARRAAEELEAESREREREETQQMLLQSEKMASLGQVVAGVAHELNNPLASVLGLAELLLRREDLPEPVGASLVKIGAEAERARRVVRNLLAFARQHAPKRVPTSLNDVVSAALALRENEMRVSNVAVVRDLAEDAPPTLADAHLLQHAFLNFMLNAEHAMLEANGRGQLTVRTRFLPRGGTRRAGPTLRVEFEDDGPGIPEPNLGRIFEPFFTTKQVGEGTGLGLSLTHSIVEQHDGVVWVESRPGQGARFIVELPHAPATQEESPAVAAAAPTALSLVGRRILLADDEPALREIGREVLAAEGCVVEEAANGREALARIEAAEFDGVVSDVRMPDLGGFEVYRQGCAIRPSLERRFLFVTGDVVSEDTVRFLEASGCLSLAKPYNVDQFLLKVRELLEA